MAIVTKTRTYNTGDNLPAGYYNADRDEIIAGVNSIDNAQIDINAGILESKIAFNINSGHNHDGSNSRLISIGWANLDFTGLTANYPVFINATANGLQTHLILPVNLDPTFALPEAQVTFDPIGGHIHDGVYSAKVPVGNLDVTGLTPLEFVRVNALGTALEVAPVTSVIHRAIGFYVAGQIVGNTDESWNPIVPENMTAIKLAGYFKQAPTLSSGTIDVKVYNATTGLYVATISFATGVQTVSTLTMTHPALTSGDRLALYVIMPGTVTFSGFGLSVILECTEP